ncbi:MAG: SH3 domain-containing protein [Spirochaetales bacterium]|nr:SH3 domain-containing protein [Spirochaetales bacterium]
MKKILLCIMVLLIAAGFQAFGESLSIIVKETQAREKPSYLSKGIAKLKYGDKVDTLQLQKDWYKVKLKGGKTGWIHSSAVTNKKIVLKSSKADAEKYANSKDVVLAGKGFNEQVEKQYKQQSKLDFSAIDKLEKIDVTPEQKEDFLRDGQLEGWEGGE